jgi:predicted aldo/keto reductase-like oxidoreductase
MEHSVLGKSGLKVSIIGLGMEHLCPAPERIAPVVHRAIDLGINYVDLMIWTAPVKDAFGAALRGHRDKVLLAAHLGVAETDGQYRRSRDVRECEALFYDWLARLHTDHVDVLHISYVDQARDWKQITQPGGMLELALRLKQEGKARCLGLSGHEPKTAKRAVESGHLDVLMHPINIAGSADQAREKLLQLCARRGVGVVAMKPFVGGEIFQREEPVSPLRCIQYSLSQPAVATALMGVKNLEELEANLKFLDATDEEKDYSPVIGEFREGLEGTCVYCNHCLPCPSGIDIAPIMRTLVTADRYGVFDDLQTDYDALPVKATGCVECGDCLERCPFGVDVIARMRQAVEWFGS